MWQKLQEQSYIKMRSSKPSGGVPRVCETFSGTHVISEGEITATGRITEAKLQVMGTSRRDFYSGAHRSNPPANISWSGIKKPPNKQKILFWEKKNLSPRCLRGPTLLGAVEQRHCVPRGAGIGALPGRLAHHLLPLPPPSPPPAPTPCPPPRDPTHLHPLLLQSPQLSTLPLSD